MKKTTIENIEVGDFIVLYTTYQVGITGFVLGKGEYTDGDGHVQRYLRMRISENNYLDIYELQITEIFLVEPGEETGKYWAEFDEKYNVKCLDDKGNLQKIPSVVKEVLVKGVWDKLSEEEKTKFVRHLDMDYETEMDLLNALDSSRKRNNELHRKVCELLDKRTETLKNAIDFQKKYDEKVSALPEQYKWIINILHKWFGAEDFVKKI